MDVIDHAGALSDISAVEFALAVALVVLSVVAGATAFLWTRWMTRQEARHDSSDARQWDVMARMATKDDLREMQRHIDGRLDRLETRIDYGAATRGAE